MNQSVSVKNLTSCRCFTEKNLCISAASIFSFRYAAHTQAKGVKDWLMISLSLLIL